MNLKTLKELFPDKFKGIELEGKEALTIDEKREIYQEVMRQIGKKLTFVTIENNPQYGEIMSNYFNLMMYVGPAILYQGDIDYDPFTFQSLGTEFEMISQANEPYAFAPVTNTNYSSEPQPFIFVVNARFEENFTYGFREGIKVGATGEVGFDIGIVNGKVSLSTELNFEANQSFSETKELGYGEQIPVTVPPYSSTSVYVDIQKTVFFGKYTDRLKPKMNDKMMDNSFWKAFFGTKNFQELFPGIDLTMEQVGTINGTTGTNWNNVVENPVPIQK